MTTVRRRGTGGGGVEAKNEFKIENAGEPKQPLVKTAAAKAEWLNSLNGGEAAKGTLTLESTSNAEKGKINLGAKGAWSEEKGAGGETAPLLGIGLTAPTAFLHLEPGAAGQPAAVATESATAAISTQTVQAPTGGNTTIATKGTGGAGSEIVFKAGTGGEATAATEESNGGVGGSLILTSGTGGKGRTASTAGTGGNGGAFSVSGGAGGEAKTKGGGGATLLFASGKGGKATTTGGEGGPIEFKSGAGGVATAGGKGGNILFLAGSGANTGGSGGKIEITAGASVGKGSGGGVEVVAGKGNEAEKGGTIVLKTEGTTRVTVTTAGSVECQKGIGAFGKVPPSLQPANPKTLKAVIEVIEGAGLAEAGTPTAAIEGTEGIFTNNLTLSGFPLSFVEEISVPEEVTEEATFTIPEAMAVPFGNVTLNGKLKVDGLLRDVEAAWPTFEESIMPIELPELSTFAVQANRQIPFGMLTTINGTIKLDGALLDY